MKILRNTVLIIVGLLLLIMLLVNFTPVQNFIVGRATSILADKLKTKVSIKHIQIDFLNHVLLQGVYIEGKEHDTLAYIGEARIRITDWFIFRKQTPVLAFAGLKKSYVHLYRKHNSADWNYQFIVDAFDTGPSTQKKKKSGGNFEIDLNKVELEDVRFHMDDAWVGNDMDFDVGYALIKANKIDFKKKLIDLNKIDFKQVAIIYKDYDGGRPPRPRKARVIDNTPFNTDKWQVKLSSLKLDDCYFGFDAGNNVAIAGEFDPEHIHVKGIDIDLEKLNITGDTITAKLNNLSAKERCGITVKKLKADVSVSPNASICKNLLLETNYSKLQRYYAMLYTRFPDFEDYIHKVVMVADLKDATVDSRDVAYFAPVLKEYPAVLHVNGKAKGTVDNVAAQNLDVNDGHSTIKGNLAMKGLPDIEKTFIDFQNGKLMTNAQGIFKYAPSLKNNESFALEKFSMIYFDGNFTGYINNFATNGLLATNMGTLRSNVKLTLPGMKTDKATYTGNMTAEDVNLGALFNNKDLGTVTIKAKVNGYSFDPAIAHIQVNSTIDHFTYRDYTYHNITMDGTIEKNKFDGNMLVDDPNLALAFYGGVDFSEKQIKLNAKANLLKSNLTALKFAKDSITVTADFDLNCTGSDIDNFSGFAKLYNINMARNGHRLDLDSVYVNSAMDGVQKTLTIESNALEAKIRGNYTLSKLGNSLQYYVSGYLPDYIKKPSKEAPPQILSVDITTKEIDSLLGIIIPKIKGFNNATINGKLNTYEQAFNLSTHIPYGEINGIILRDVDINSNGNYSSLSVNTSVKQLVVGDSAVYGTVDVNAQLGNNQFTFKILTASPGTYGTATLNGHALAHGDTLDVSINPSDFLLSQNKWTIPGGTFTLANNYLYVRELKVQSDGQSINIYSKNNSLSSTPQLIAEINNLDITPLIELTNTKDFSASGRINGIVSIDDITGNMVLNCDLKATNVQIANDTLGNLTIKGSYDVAKKLVNLENTSGIYKGNSSIVASGQLSFDSTNSENLKGHVQINNTPIDWLSPLLDGYVSRLGGTINGDINIEGSAMSPNVYGQIEMVDAAMRIDFLGTYYKIPKASINVNETAIDFGQMVVHDQFDNVALLTGKIKHKRFNDMEFDVRMKSQKIEVINLKENESELFYGNLIAAIKNFTVTGKINDVKIGIQGAQPVEKSHLYLPLASSNGLGTYNYVSFETSGQEQNLTPKVKNKLSISISAIMTEQAEISLVLDPTSGDAINATGTGALTIDIPHGNELRMSGRYTITEGDYTFTLKDLFFKRNFKLDEGSQIFFNGPIEKTQLDVQGIYTVKTTLSGLLTTQEIAAASEKEKKEIQTKQPINIRLYMKGSMGSPAITFKLESNDNSSIAGNKLQIINQDNLRLNNQVASLLLFGGFISEGSSAGVAQNAVTGSISSVSQVFTGKISSELSDALSKLTGDKSLQIALNYNSYSSGLDNNTTDPNNNRNEVSFGIKKNLFRGTFNDRLSLEVGSKYDWGKNTNTSSSSSNFNPVGDFRLQYQFRDGGNIRGYIFRTSSYDVLQNNNIARGGIGINWHRSFNKMTEFFRGRKYFKRKQEEEEKKNAEIKDTDTSNGTY